MKSGLAVGAQSTCSRFLAMSAIGNFSDSLVGGKGRFDFGIISRWEMAGNRQWHMHPHWKKWPGSPSRESCTPKKGSVQEKKMTKNFALLQRGQIHLSSVPS